MQKIPNLLKQNYEINQGKHDQKWNNLLGRIAIDFNYTGALYAPFDGCYVDKVWKPRNKQDWYFTLVLPDKSKLIIVHAEPIVAVGQILKAGQAFSRCTWHHYHISLLLNTNNLACVLDYTDRSINMFTNKRLYGRTDHPDGKWSTYKDLYLNIQNNNMDKQQLINQINTQPFDDQTRKMLIQAVHNNDASYLVAFAGSQPRAWLNQKSDELNQALTELEAKPKQVEVVNLDEINRLNAEIEELKATKKVPESNSFESSMGNTGLLQPVQANLEDSIVLSEEVEAIVKEEIKKQETIELYKELLDSLVSENKDLQKKVQGFLPDRLKSRKLWAFISGVAVLVASTWFPDLQEITTEVTAIIATYIVGQGVVDATKN